MKTLQLKINDYLYDTLLAMLKGLSKKDIEIIELNKNTVNISQKKVPNPKIASKKLSAHSLRGSLQHSGKIIPTELLCKPVEYANDSF